MNFTWSDTHFSPLSILLLCIVAGFGLYRYFAFAKIKRKLKSLAAFPEQNPNLVTEISLDTLSVSYANPAAKRIFPDIEYKDIKHPLFSKVPSHNQYAGKNKKSIETLELTIDGRVFEQKINFFPDEKVIRIYSSDITDIKLMEKKMARLATFPEQNPNPVIEIDHNWEVSYANAAAHSHFPDLKQQHTKHSILSEVREIVKKLKADNQASQVCEIHTVDKIYERKVIAFAEDDIIRVYCNDITERIKTEELIKEKNREITDSINYAKRIQNSILPTPEELEQAVGDYFVLYIPKDIVAGDFYWAIKFKTPEYDFGAIAAVDCTGHGVPGAFMSLIGYTLLNQTINNPRILQASDVLNYLNSELPNNLKSSGVESSIKDGMDMTLCAIDNRKMQLHYVGANNPVWIIRNKELIALKPDKQAITASNEMEKRPFTNHIVDLQKGDCIYLFTDGYADQFGGPFGKKFMYKPFKELLIANSDKSLNEQKKVLEQAFNTWKGDLEQVDDVLVIGVRV